MSFSQLYKEYFPFWEVLSDSDKRYLCDNSSVVHFEKEQAVHNNAECSGLYIVKNGKLRLYSSISNRVLEVKNYALEVAVQRFSDVMWIMQQIVFMSMDKRLAIFLLDEVSAGGTDIVVMTHEQIARHLGSAREVITRMLKRFSSDGMIEVNRKGIKVIDRKKLRDIAL